MSSPTNRVNRSNQRDTAYDPKPLKRAAYYQANRVSGPPPVLRTPKAPLKIDARAAKVAALVLAYEEALNCHDAPRIRAAIQAMRDAGWDALAQSKLRDCPIPL